MNALHRIHIFYIALFIFIELVRFIVLNVILVTQFSRLSTVISDQLFYTYHFIEEFFEFYYLRFTPILALIFGFVGCLITEFKQKKSITQIYEHSSIGYFLKSLIYWILFLNIIRIVNFLLSNRNSFLMDGGFRLYFYQQNPLYISDTAIKLFFTLVSTHLLFFYSCYVIFASIQEKNLNKYTIEDL